MALRMRMCRRVFSIAIAQTQTEQTRSPIITDLDDPVRLQEQREQRKIRRAEPDLRQVGGIHGLSFSALRHGPGLRGLWTNGRGDQKEAARSVIRRSAEPKSARKIAPSTTGTATSSSPNMSKLGHQTGHCRPNRRRRWLRRGYRERRHLRARPSGIAGAERLEIGGAAGGGTGDLSRRCFHS